MSEPQFAKNYLAGLTGVIGGIDPDAIEQAIAAIRQAHRETTAWLEQLRASQAE